MSTAPEDDVFLDGQKADPSMGAPSVFLDTASYRDILVVFSVYLLFELCYVFIAYHHPRLATVEVVDYPLVQTFSNRVATVIAKIESLDAYYSFSIGAAVIRQTSAHDFESSLNLSQTLELFAGSNPVYSPMTSNRTVLARFSEGSDVSNDVGQNLNMLISGYDAVTVHLSVEGDLYFCKGFRLMYRLVESRLRSVRNSVTLVLFLGAIYVTVGYIVTSTGESLRAQTIYFGLGATLISSMNPMSLLLNGVEMMSAILTPVFLEVFRLYVMIMLDATIHSASSSPKHWAIIYIPFLLVYWAVETLENCGYCSAQRLMLCHVIYSLGTLALLCYAWITCAKTHFTRLVGYSPFILSTLFATLICGTVFHGYDSWQFFVYDTSHILAAMAFFFFQSAASYHYKTIAQATSDSSDIVIDIDLDGLEEETESDDE